MDFRQGALGWDLSCLDWRERIVAGESLVPDLPLFEAEADIAVSIFDELRLPDVIGQPRFGDAVGDWYRDIVRAAFGSCDPVTMERMIRDIFALVPKGQAKTTYSAGLMITAMLMNQRSNAEMLFVGPTQSISDRAFEQAAGIIAASPELYGGPGRSGRFHVKFHQKEIEDLANGATMKVKTFALDILTGSMPVLVLLDELHLLGRNHHAAKVLRQIRGGLEKRSEGLFLIITTQSDERPAGVFKSELENARKIRDGAFRGKPIRPLLPVLYEFPEEMAEDPVQWQDPDNWHIVMPNLGRSMDLRSLWLDWESERSKGPENMRIWASQHLNIEIGVGARSDGWAGADFWQKREDPTLTLDDLIARCEVIVVGIDGGGLDDLFGLCVLGREKETRRWLAWCHAWAHRGVLERRKIIADRLEAFGRDGFLTIVDDELDDQTAILAVVEKVDRTGKLVCVAIDKQGPFGEFVDGLTSIGVTEDAGKVEAVRQGMSLMDSIKTLERKLANGTFVHARSDLMDWCVANVRIEPTATGIRATKQNAGDAKIDPVMAMFDAASIMIRNPEAVSVFDAESWIASYA